MSKVDVKEFERTQRGEQTKLYMIRNDAGESVTLCNFGATVMSVKIYDKNQMLRDVVLGYEHLIAYETGSMYFGATVGRCCGRIAEGKFPLNGSSYQLDTNHGPNHLHGGRSGFSHRIWDAEIIKDGVRFQLFSPDGDQGYPGNLSVWVSYTFDDFGVLSVSYHAVSDKDTICNLTNHTYFNLNGHGGGSIVESGHSLQVHATSFLPLDRMLIPTGEIRRVEESAFDFNKKRLIGEVLSAGQEKEDIQMDIAHGIDHMFVVNGETDRKLVLAAKAECEESGISLSCYTTQKGIHIYIPGYMRVSAEYGKDHVGYDWKYGAFCMETEGYPDAPNHENFPTTILRAGEEYKHETQFVFQQNH